MSDYSRTRSPATPEMTTTESGENVKELVSKTRVLTSNGTENIFNRSSKAISILGELQQEEYAQKIGGKAPIELKSQVLLGSLGFSIVKNEELSAGLQNLKDYSLIGSTNVDKTIENKKIIDPDLDMLTPIKAETFDKFKSATDAFYELDEERSRSIKKIEAEEQIHHKKILNKVSRDVSRIARKSHNKMLSKQAKRGLK
jgi:hypothetical protein